jgi:hypothetical protein
MRSRRSANPRRRFAAALLVSVLAACRHLPGNTDGGSKPRPSALPAATLTLQSLDMRVAKLEKSLEDAASEELKKIPVVSCKGEGFTTVVTNNGLFLVSCDDASAYLNGFKLKLRIGNPSALTYNGIKLTIFTAQAVIPNDIVQDFLPGAWTSVDVVVAPATAAAVSSFIVKIETNKVSLRHPR